MNPLLQQVLTALSAAAAATLSAVKGATDTTLSDAEADVPKLSDEGLNFLETTVAPKLDVPPSIVAYFKSQNATLEGPADAYAEAEIALFKARVDALFPASV